MNGRMLPRLNTRVFNVRGITVEGALRLDSNTTRARNVKRCIQERSFLSRETAMGSNVVAPQQIDVVQASSPRMEKGDGFGKRSKEGKKGKSRFNSIKVPWAVCARAWRLQLLANCCWILFVLHCNEREDLAESDTR